MKKTSIEPLKKEINRTKRKHKVEESKAKALIFQKHIGKAKGSLKKAIFALMKFEKIDEKLLTELREIERRLK